MGIFILIFHNLIIFNLINYFQPNIPLFQSFHTNVYRRVKATSLITAERKLTPWIEALKDFYVRAAQNVKELIGPSDEYVAPLVAVDKRTGKPIGRIQKGDLVIHFNFRTDRIKELAYVLSEQFKGNKFRELNEERFAQFESDFSRDKIPEIEFLGLTRADENFTYPFMVSPVTETKNSLGEIVSTEPQFRVAETAKYPHTTFFFNQEQNAPFPLEDRVQAPSPAVATYDLAPEMNAAGVTDAAIKFSQDSKYKFGLVNFANADMVGHTGNWEAAIKAVETVDKNLKRLAEEAVKNGWTLVVTADHGNAEKMRANDGGLFTQHTTNPVPLIIYGLDQKVSLRKGGTLGDVAATVLQLKGKEKPKEMSGTSLLENYVPKATDKDRKVLLVVLDGWGYSEEKEWNAIAQANTPFFDELWDSGQYPTTLLKASGEAVGIREGDMGTSEIGHRVLGRGGAVDQPILVIDKSIRDGSFSTNPKLKTALEELKKRGGRLHLLGLLSDGNIHSAMEHLMDGFLEVVRREGIETYLHPFLDGRDSPTQKSPEFLLTVQKKIEDLGVGDKVKIATLMGRYFGMDRENYYDRIKRAIYALIYGEGQPIYIDSK